MRPEVGAETDGREGVRPGHPEDDPGATPALTEVVRPVGSKRLVLVFPPPDVHREWALAGSSGECGASV